MAATYVDSSILVAVLSPDDAGHTAVTAWIAGDEAAPFITSALAEVEIGRALVRRRAPAWLRAAARRLLARLEMIEPTASIRAAAVEVQPSSVRSLDALHIATALAAEAARFASLDHRQIVAAEEMGLATWLIGLPSWR